MFEGPQIRIEVERMKYSIIHMFAQHNQEIEDAVSKELDIALKNYPFAQQVQKTANEILDRAIKSAIEDYLLYGDGYKQLQQAIQEIVDKVIVKAK